MVVAVAAQISLLFRLTNVFCATFQGKDAMPSLYILASTASSAGINEDTVTSLQNSFGRNVVALNVGNTGQYWSNGFVLRLHSSSPPLKSKPWVQDGLRGSAEFWLMHDGRGNAVDNMSDGPGTMAMRKLGSRSVCQLFLRYDLDDQRKADRIAQLLADFEKHGVEHKYAFGFSNGRVYFLTGLQSARTIFRRCESALRTSIEYVLIDGQEICYGPQGEIDEETLWTRLRPVRSWTNLAG